MTNQLVILILLCPAIVWFSVILLPHHHVSQTKVVPSTSTIDPPWSQNPWTTYFQFKPKPLSRSEILFYDFNPFLAFTEQLHQEYLIESMKQTEHQETTVRLNYLDNPMDKEVKRAGHKMFAFNMLVSNRIGLTRLLPDTRPTKCPRVEHESINQLTQKVSIIICYYNEAPSALLRTIYSILLRSRHELIHEILVVDDYSEFGYDMAHIEPYLKHLPLVKIVRTERREGLIRARQFGADLVRGDIMVFLDSHVEANVGWLEPLIKTIEHNKTTIACPMIDLINYETLVYTASPMVRGGLTWSLHFKWDSVPSEDLRTKDDFVKPIRTSTMAGGLYAINRDYFYHLGAYDMGMDLWGGENIELSLRIWMCGGSIVILPCSRMGHIFRRRRPYGPAPNQPDSLLYNSHRTALVWLGDKYLSKFYGQQPDAASLPSGGVADRLALRQRLKCHSFEWFMDNIYPNLRNELEEFSNGTVETTGGIHDDGQHTLRPKLFEPKARTRNRQKQ